MSRPAVFHWRVLLPLALIGLAPLHLFAGWTWPGPWVLPTALGLFTVALLAVAEGCFNLWRIRRRRRALEAEMVRVLGPERAAEVQRIVRNRAASGP